eukprot:9030041-Alexandrium_andersonii.AAC.1
MRGVYGVARGSSKLEQERGDPEGERPGAHLVGRMPRHEAPKAIGPRVTSDEPARGAHNPPTNR